MIYKRPKTILGKYQNILIECWAGRITGFLDIPANPCLEVETKNGTSVLVPFHEDLILSADPEARMLEMEIPDGLLDL